MEEKINFGNIKRLEITPKEGYILVAGIVPGGSVDTEFETRIYHDGEIETCHRGIGKGYIWTDWQKNFIVWGED